MRVVLAVDKLKGALSSEQFTRALEKGFLKARDDIKISKYYLSDGGDGFIKALYSKALYRKVWVNTYDPLMREMKTHYILSHDRNTAVFESALTIGYSCLKDHERRTAKTSSYGLGILIKDAIKRGAKKLIIGLGGSATTDGGIGMASAVGYRFLDKRKRDIIPIGENLLKITDIDDSKVLPQIKKTHVIVAADVTNPLCGERGAVRVYACQKGASEREKDLLERGLQSFSKVVKKVYKVNIATLEGAGSAGGLGGGCVAFLGATVVRGADFVLAQTDFCQDVKQASWVITGEGKIDKQTSYHKLPYAVARQAKEYHVKTIAICGSLQASEAEIRKMGFHAVFSMLDRPMTLDDALRESRVAATKIAFHIARLL